MGRLYSNPNAWRRGLNLGRVTDQQLRLVSSRGVDAAEANSKLAELDEAVGDHHSKQALRRILKIKRLMEARKDKRRRPRGVSKRDFVLYRKLRLKLPSTKKKKAKQPN